MSEPKSESNPSPLSSKSQAKRVFTEEFKREAVRLATERGNLSAVAHDLGIHESVLNRWKREVQKEAEQTVSSASDFENRSFAAFPGQRNPSDEDSHLLRKWAEETSRLQREYRRLRQEVEILKKAIVFTSRLVC